MTRLPFVLARGARSLSITSRIVATLRLLVTAGALAILPACHDSLAPNGVAGVYLLTKVDGKAPPVAVDSSIGYMLEILSGSYTIDAISTFSSEGTYRETNNGTPTTATLFTGGTYALHGTAITFTEQDGTTLTGVIGHGSLTITEKGITAEFARSTGSSP